MEPTPHQRMASLLLGKPVDVWIRERRATGRSWRLIARDLYEATGGQVDVTHEALRRWIERSAA